MRDRNGIRNITEEAFKDSPHSDHTEQCIIEALRNAGKLSVSLVVEIDGKTVGHVASGLDSVFYTDQEQAEGRARTLDMRMGMVKSLQDEFTPRAVTRRILALIIFANFLF